MKKIIIILAVILTTGLTALSITRTDNKTPTSKNSEKAAFANRSLSANADNLATAD